MTRAVALALALLAYVSTANAASELSKADEIRLKRAIAECLVYVSLKDPKGFAELYSDRPSKERSRLSFVFNGCVASRGPLLIWR
jgi:hypothetical protein